MAKSAKVDTVTEVAPGSFNINVIYTDSDTGQSINDTVGIYQPTSVKYVEDAIKSKGNQVLIGDDFGKKFKAEWEGKTIDF